ncbi:hypothetical protein NKH77_35440 [Streptomyces sp. M19]
MVIGEGLTGHPTRNGLPTRDGDPTPDGDPTRDGNSTSADAPPTMVHELPSGTVAVVVGDHGLAAPPGSVDLRHRDPADAERHLLAALDPVTGQPAVWGGVPRRNPTSPGATPCSPRSATGCAPPRRAAPSSPWWAWRASARRNSRPSTPTGSPPTTTSCGGPPRATATRYRGGSPTSSRLGPDRAFVDEDDRAWAALDALRRGVPYDRWLLVLDGADSPEEIGVMLPTGHGHVLITSYNRAWGGHYAQPLDVPPFTREESLAFLERRASRLLPAEAEELAAAVEDLPLPLDQTARHLDDTTIQATPYLRSLVGGEPVPVKPAAPYPVAYPSPTRPWSTGCASGLPRRPNCCGSGPASAPAGPARPAAVRPADLLTPALAEMFREPVRLEAAVAELVRYALVRVEGEALHLSRFVHEAAERRVPDHRRQARSGIVRRALAAFDPRKPDDEGAWPRYAEIVPRLEPSGVLKDPTSEMCRLVVNCLRYLELTGGHRQGLRIMDEVRHPIPESVPSRTALLRQAGQYERAERLDRAALGPGPITVPGITADLRGLARYEEALTLAGKMAPGIRNAEQAARCGCWAATPRR